MAREYSCWAWPLAVAAAILPALPAIGSEPSAITAAEEELPRLISQLDAEQFAQRQAASTRLAHMGRAALPILESAAESGSREISSRALGILRQHLLGDDNELQHAATAALERISHSGSLPIARQASSALQFLNGPDMPLIVYHNHRGANGGKFRRLTTHVTGGRQVVEVEQHDRQKIEIHTLPTGSIEMVFAKEQEGHVQQRTVKGRNLAELMRKDAEAARLYEQFDALADEMIQVTLRPPVALFPQVLRQPADPWGPMIRNFDEQIARLKADLPQNPDLQQIVDRLEANKQRVVQAQQARK
jgi:hypothetical protein